MRRREFITLLGGTAVWTVAAIAQQAVPLIAYLTPGDVDETETKERHAAFQSGLEQAGWFDGKNVHIEHRWGVLGTERVVATVTEIIRLQPQVIVAQGSPISTALREQTSTIPIVFVGASDPVSSGLVRSMARPGGNVTGFVNFEFAMGAKWVQTLKELAPSVTRVLVLGARENAGNQGLYKAAEAAAPALGVDVTAALVDRTEQVQDAIRGLSQQPDGGLVVLPTNFAVNNRPLILDLTAQHRIPAIYPVRIFAAEGGLASLDTDSKDYYRRAGTYADRVLRGENPGDLPVQLPTKYQLAINLKTAVALGLNVPVTLLGRADEVIE